MPITWSGYKTIFPGQWNGAAWNDSLCLLVSYNFAVNHEHSADGQTWVDDASFAGATLSVRNLTKLDDGTIVGFGQCALYTTDNNWSQLAFPGGSFSVSSDYCAGNGTVAFTSDSNTASNKLVVFDGSTLTARTYPSSGDWYCVGGVPGGGNLIALKYGTNQGAYSNDHGATWNAVTLPATGNWSSMCADATGAVVAVAYGSSTALRSTNGGVSWSVLALPATRNWTDIKVVGQSTWLLIATGTSDAYTSTDHGASWSLSSMPSSQQWSVIASNGYDAVVISRDDPASVDNVAFATIDTPPTPPPELGSSEIVFEPLVWSPDTQGELVMALPALRMLAGEVAVELALELPPLEFVATGMSHLDGELVATLPALELRAHNFLVGITTTYTGELRSDFAALRFVGDDLIIDTPQVATLIALLPALDFVAEGGDSVLGGELVAELQPLQALFSDVSGNSLVAQLPPLSVRAFETIVAPSGSVSLQAQPVMSVLGSNTWVVNSAITMSDEMEDEVFFVLASRLQASDHASFLGNFIMAIESNLVVRDFLRFAIEVSINDALDVADVVEITPEAVLALASELMLRDETLGLMTAVQTIASALVFIDRARFQLQGTVTSAADFADVIEANLALVRTLTSEAMLLDEATGVLYATAIVSSGVVFGDSFEALLTALMTLDDGFGVAVRFTTPDGDSFAGYLLNVRNAAVSELDNFPFNAFAALSTGGQAVTLATGKAGVYQLGGDTDEGAAIAARVYTGLTDFGSTQLKRVANAVFGYTADGALRLKVVTTDGGRKKENWYKLKARSADSPVEGGVNIAKGLVARYWGFEVENIDGADFQLDDLRVWPALLQRRNSGR